MSWVVRVFIINMSWVVRDAEIYGVFSKLKYDFVAAAEIHRSPHHSNQ